MKQTTDRIQKQVLLRSPIERVWQAITNAREFGTWFGAEFDGEFVAGARLSGRIKPTQVDADVAKQQQPHDGVPFEVVVERIDPLCIFSFKWHPYFVDPGADPASEPMTLVTFELKEAEGGTMLTISESGFDQVPLARRAEAFTSNEEGWSIQTTLIAKYLTQSK